MKIVFAIALLSLQLAWYECCTCMPKHPQTAFCKAHFVIKGIVISEPYTKPPKNKELFEQLGIPVPTFVYYKVLVTRVFKGNVTSKESSYSSFFAASIRTSKGEAQCGTSLKKGTSYVITGRQYNGELQINKCDWVEEYTKLSKQMRKGIRGEYDCGCEIAVCLDGYCTNNDSLCKWTGIEDRPMDDCTQRHRACRKIVDQCHWVHHKTYTTCHKKATIQRFIPYKL